MHPQRILPVLVLVLIAGCSFFSSEQRTPRFESEEELVAYAKGVHERAITIDSHADISDDFASEKEDVGSADNRRQVTLPKMRKGGLDVEFFAVFTGTGDRSAASYESAYKNALARFDAIHRLSVRYPDEVAIAVSPADVVRINASGKLVACIGVENGYPIATDISRVKEFYDRGARYITLTHTGHNQICDSSTPREGQPPEEYGGLSEFGRQVVREMNRLGIMIDISHASKNASLEVLRLSKAPIIASHSGASGVNEHPRNLDDETLRELKRNGGVVQLVSLAEYIKRREDSPERLAALTELRKEFGLPEGRGLGMRRAMQTLSQEQIAKLREKMREIDVKFPRTPVTVQDMVNHIDHIVKVISIDHVGIGSDFDGGGGLTGWGDASESLNITVELVRRGYSENDIKKIWGENLLRVWREVERVSENMK